MEKNDLGYCDICDMEEVELEITNERLIGGEPEATYSMCKWCYNVGASEPLRNCFEKNQRMGELSRGLRYLHSLLAKQYGKEK